MHGDPARPQKTGVCWKGCYNTMEELWQYVQMSRPVGKSTLGHHRLKAVPMGLGCFLMCPCKYIDLFSQRIWSNNQLLLPARHDSPQGYAPSTNNALESTYSRIKSDFTFRSRLPFDEFIVCVKDDIIHTWSTDRDPSIAHQDNLKAFVQTPTADTTPLLDSAWKWVLLAKNIISKGNKHYIASGLLKKNEHQPADITTYESALKKTSWKSYDVFIREINICRVVTLNNQDFRRCKCSCPSYDKKEHLQAHHRRC
ncbi:hypothetical protein BpHYR1_025409 [Brachionus plicatilis]|uniref:Uncharacterized protein n=1 Tax=Brachionus plicatilis TaxID=10195 RepID=A0A3M7Q9Z4_BRAPC|nr:hypothetical protein BpHYR1_025409 [Brachionus plicatilis]